MKAGDGKPDYGNWVSNRMLLRVSCAALILGALGALLWTRADGWLPAKILLALAAAFALAFAVYLCWARRAFSPKGGDLQNKVPDLLVSRISWDGKGKALDIGCGSGALTVRVAKLFPEAEVTGVDQWGGGWSYGRAQCESNARKEGAADRTVFVEGSARRLPFPDGSFDLVVSNLTFHEVRGSTKKTELIREALRVLRRGGVFVFQDLFQIRPMYGTREELLAAVEKMGAVELRFTDTSPSPFIPRALKLPFMLGTIALISGRKAG